MQKKRDAELDLTKATSLGSSQGHQHNCQLMQTKWVKDLVETVPKRHIDCLILELHGKADEEPLLKRHHDGEADEEPLLLTRRWRS